MSIEALIAANTEALQRLTAVLQSQQITPAADAPAPAPAAPKATRAKKEDKQTPAADTGTANTSATINDGKTLSVKLQPGDPEGTRYYHIAAHNTVAAVKPGEPIPSIAGMVEVGGDEYASLKAKYSGALVPQAGNVAAGTSTPAANATGAAQTASSPAQAPSPATPPIDSGVTVMEKCKALHARDGNDGLAAFLKAMGVGRVGELVGNTAKHTDALAALEKLLNPAAAGAPDLF